MPMEPPSSKSPQKPTLITPSASPPPIALPFRVSASAAPPNKRQRVSSTPHRTITDGGPTSRTETPIDVEKEREASKMRLFNVWSSLAERYTRHIDDDDIVDLRTGKITKDNGFLRNAPKFDFGTFTSTSGDDAIADDISNSSAEDDIYGVDELDAFSEDDIYGVDELDSFADEYADISSKLEDFDDDEEDDEGTRSGPKTLVTNIRPITPLGPADADDLREFLNAERQRKEECGTDAEDDDDTGSDNSSLGKGGSDDRFPEGHGKKADISSSLKKNPVMQNKNHANDRIATKSTGTAPPTAMSVKKFDDRNEHHVSTIKPFAKKKWAVHKIQEDSDKEVDSIESPTKVQPSLKPVHQLYTPPLSISSSPSRISEMSSSRPKSMSSSSKIREACQTKVQKSTRTDDVVDYGSRNIPRIDLSRPRISHKSTNSSTLKAAVSSKNEAIALKPIVLLTPRRRLSSTENHSSTVEDRDKPSDHSDKPFSKDLKGKGKVNETASVSNYSHRDISEGIVSKARKTASRNHERSSDDESHISSFPTSKQKLLPHKRENEENPPSSETHSSGSKRKPPEKNKKSFPSTSKKVSPQKLSSNKAESSNPSRKRKRPSFPVESDESDGIKQERFRDRSKSKSLGCRSSSRPRIGSPKSDDTRKGKDSESASESEGSTESSASNAGKSRQRPRSRSRPLHYHYPEASYSTYAYPPQNYATIADPRAQIIIAQAVQQLTALVTGGSWPNPHPLQYTDDSVPRTPSHRRLANNPFITPTHRPHPYPYSYDPNMSHATLPPDSPEILDSSPDKPTPLQRKSLVQRSRSRGRTVSFQVERGHSEDDDTDGHFSSVAKKSWTNEKDEKSKPTTKKVKKQKQARRSETPNSSYDDSDVDTSPHKPYARGRTPGPNFETSDTQVRETVRLKKKTR